MFIHLLLLFAMALSAGFVGSLLGLGGGIIIVPALALLFHMPIHHAIAASILAMIATSIGGAKIYMDQQITNVRIGLFLEVATTFGALAGAFLGVLMKGWILSLVFSGIMFLIGFVSFRERGSEDREDADGNGVVPDRLSRYMELGGAYYDRAKDREVQYKATRSLQGSGAALMAGLGSGMLGIGGGVIKVAALNTVMRVPIKASVATSKFMIGITAATAAVVYFLADAVNLCVVAPVALGAVVGAVAGSHLMNRLKSRLLKTIFALLLFYMAYEMLGRALLHGFRLHLPGLM